MRATKIDKGSFKALFFNMLPYWMLGRSNFMSFSHHLSKFLCGKVFTANLILPAGVCNEIGRFMTSPHTHVNSVVLSHHLLAVCSAYNLLVNRQNGLVGHCSVCRYYFVLCAQTADVPRSKLRPHIDYRQKRGMNVSANACDCWD